MTQEREVNSRQLYAHTSHMGTGRCGDLDVRLLYNFLLLYPSHRSGKLVLTSSRIYDPSSQKFAWNCNINTGNLQPSCRITLYLLPTRITTQNDPARECSAVINSFTEQVGVEYSRMREWGSIYRLTHHVGQNLPLTWKQKLRFSKRSL